MTPEDLRVEARPLISVREAASVLGIPLSSCYDALRTGTFPVPAIRVGGRIYVNRDALLRLLGGEER